MKQTVLWAGLAAGMLAAAAGPAGRSAPADGRPVLVELFTSEGCSSCPPADALLAELDREQPVAGARIIVLSEHVDYWNHLGWADPFSSAAFSARQEGYARRFGLSGPYTPQMVVDGHVEFVGSDAVKARAAIQAEVREPPVAVRIIRDPEGPGLTLEVDPLPPGQGRRAIVYVARAEDSGTSNVLRGENQGRRLRHVSIVRELKALGTINPRKGFRTSIHPASGNTPARWIAFVQDAESGVIRGAALHAGAKVENTAGSLF